MRALFAAATGLSAQQTRIDNIANNLANVSTPGFKKSREVFEDLMYQQLSVGDTSAEVQRPGQVQIGTGTRVVATTRDFSAGTAQYTGDRRNLAIKGGGFFVVEAPDGTERYTRDGTFMQNSDGELATQAGLRVSPGVQFPDGATVDIAEDGTITATYTDDPTHVVTLGTIELVDFANPNGLQAIGGNLYAATPESGDPIPMDPERGDVHILQGYTEASNVDVAEELVAMIMAQRAFELTSKVMETADETLQTVTNLKR
ncbi:MAG: flagellar basal-body rod protein FlgG [Pseudomonadota bacterium]